VDIKEFEDKDLMAERAAGFIAEKARFEIAESGFFSMALSGGNSPREIYTRLADENRGIDWKKVYVFWGDDRYIPHDNRESNYNMAYETLLSKVKIPAHNIYRIPTEVTPIGDAAELYERIMRKFFASMKAIDVEKKMPRFGLIILGVGRDGHTASLFPGHKAVNEKARWVVNVKAHARTTLRERITITLPVINAAKNVMFVVSGEGKGGIIKDIAGSGRKKEAYPASKVNPDSGRSVWFIDKNVYE